MPVGVSRTAKKKKSVSVLRHAPSVAVRNLYICTIGGVCVSVCVCKGRGRSGGCKESDKSLFFFCAQHRPEMIKRVSFSSQKKTFSVFESRIKV